MDKNQTVNGQYTTFNLDSTTLTSASGSPSGPGSILPVWVRWGMGHPEDSWGLVRDPRWTFRYGLLEWKEGDLEGVSPVLMV
jgi:hypothetical protein